MSVKRKYRRYSPAEDRILSAALSVAPVMSLSEIARDFRRQRPSVYQRAVKLGLKGPNRLEVVQ